MAILGIDYGSKKIGLAKSDEQNSFAMPLEILKSDDRNIVLANLKKIIEEDGIERIVVGVPISLNGGPADGANLQLSEVIGFIDWLKANLELPVEEQDERLSSKMAGNLIKGSPQKGDDDAVAAMLILQSYLDKLKN